MTFQFRRHFLNLHVRDYFRGFNQNSKNLALAQGLWWPEAGETWKKNADILKCLKCAIIITHNMKGFSCNNFFSRLRHFAVKHHQINHKTGFMGLVINKIDRAVPGTCFVDIMVALFTNCRYICVFPFILLLLKLCNSSRVDMNIVEQKTFDFDVKPGGLLQEHEESWVSLLLNREMTRHVSKLRHRHINYDHYSQVALSMWL